MLCYIGNDRDLKTALKQGGKYFANTFSEDPLALSISRRSKQCQETIIKRFKNCVAKQNVEAFRYIDNQIEKLNLAGLPSLHHLYEDAFP